VNAPEAVKTHTFHRKLITLMVFGYRMEAIAILGREVMLPRGLVGLGFDSIDHCGPEIAEVSEPALNPRTSI
jgi:protein-tyrosine phosphatase